MRVLRNSVCILSKLKINYSTTLNAKLSISHRKLLSRKIVSPSNFSTFKYLSIRSTHNANSFSHKQGKLFKEIENEYAHKLMEDMPAYSKSLVKNPLSSDIKFFKSERLSSPIDIIDEFIEVTYHCMSEGLTLENSKFVNLVREICTRIPDATDENIRTILHHLCLWPPTSSTTTPNFKLLWQTLDQECVKRLNRWDVSQKLLIADYWFHLKLSRITYYNSAVILNLVKNIDSLANHEVIQLMFYVNLQRRIPDLYLSSLEKKLESVIKSSSVEELGIVCLGFFKTQNKISSVTLIEHIIRQFMRKVEGLNTVTVAAILKFLRISKNPLFTDLYILTLHKCIPCINNFDIPTSVHLALLASECNIYHPLLLNCVTEKLIREMDKVRIKDCAKFLICVSLFNHFEEKFYFKFLSEVKKEERQRELVSHPEHILHSVLSYAYMGHYDYDLISNIFKKEFINRSIILYPEIRYTFAEIAYCLEIECPDYTGPKLVDSEKNILGNRRGNLPSKSSQNMQTRLLSEIYESFVDILGNEKNVLIRHVLPHVYAPDIIVRLSGNMDQPLSEVCQKYSTDLILKPPSNEIWAAFVVCSMYSFARRSTHVTGITSMKLRQLEKLGYLVTSIPYFNVSRKKTERNVFLREKLSVLDGKKQKLFYKN